LTIYDNKRGWHEQCGNGPHYGARYSGAARSADRGPVPAFTTPVAAIRLTVNELSSLGAKVVATILQAGIG